jgi:hypothetical protein
MRRKVAKKWRKFLGLAEEIKRLYVNSWGGKILKLFTPIFLRYFL